MSAFDFYLEHDHDARRRVMLLSVAFGAFAGCVADVLGLTSTQAVVVCALATGLTELLGALRYVEPNRKARREIELLPVRRTLMVSLASTLVVFVVSRLGIPNWEALACEQELLGVSKGPSNPTNAIKARKLLVRARGARVYISASSLGRTGSRFVQASRQDPVAWETVLAFMDYKTFLNEASLEIPPSTGSSTLYTSYEMHVPVGKTQPELSVLGIVPRDSSARFNPIGEDANQSNPRGAAVIFARGGALLLDGFEFRSVVFQDCYLAYDGGPLKLTSVYFVRCNFEMGANEKSRSLALAVLSPSASTTFSIE